MSESSSFANPLSMCLPDYARVSFSIVVRIEHFKFPDARSRRADDRRNIESDFTACHGSEGSGLWGIIACIRRIRIPCVRFPPVYASSHWEPSQYWIL